jgi:glycosyltransferase involved in cell wall biosynthesis
VSPRVALVVSTTADDSSELLAARLRHLLAAGWEATLLCKGKARVGHPALRDPALRGHVEFAPDAASDSSPFDGRLRELRPDLVHFHSGWAAWRAEMLGGDRDCRVVVSFREDGQDLALPDARRVWDAADLLLFPSVVALERAAVQGWPAERAAILPAHVAGLGLAPGDRPPAELRVLSAGPLLWEQGLEHSIHAVALLAQSGVGCEYRILGEGEHVGAVAFARHQLGVSDCVHLLSPDGADRLAEELLAADVLVDAAVTETTSPAGLVAAMAAGIPFVATGRPGLATEAGLIVPRRDPRALAEALGRLAADPDLRARLGEAGLRHSGAYTLGEHLGLVERLYRRALENRER